MGFFDSFFTKEKKEDLDQGLEKTKGNLFGQISKALVGKSKVDDDFLDELEGILISADVGLDTTVKIIERLEEKVAEEKYVNAKELNQLLRDVITDLLAENNTVDIADFVYDESEKPHVILVVGVNGVGKTTTIGKLAHQYVKRGKKVLLGAGDTFRAAAVDQLEIWSERSGADFYSKGMDADPGAVAYETTKYAMDNDYDVAIIDTAGRLHTKKNLMRELEKIKNSVTKAMPSAPHEVLIVLDASTGQNAFEQYEQFSAATEISAMALTKLDGTAKGGVVLGLSDNYKVPIRYIGVGEGMDQLQVFNRMAFVESLFEGV